ncbi:Ethanolamine operon regulatory protein [Klebsiella pneumoniae IS22]|nr:Ethanolamine operon regulatory protein [Klebsiella pneumoniae IS22]
MVLSEDVITRQANFLHNPDRVLHMLRNQSALEVKEQHKSRAVGLCPTGAGDVLRESGKSPSACSAKSAGG